MLHYELHVAALMKDDELRSIASQVIKPWMFSDPIALKLYGSLTKLKVYDWLYVQAGMSDGLSDAEMNAIKAMLDGVPSPLSHDHREQATVAINEFIRKQTLAFVIRKINIEGYKDEIFHLARDVQVVPTLNGHAYNFSDPAHIQRAQQAMFGAGTGRIIKSSFDLVNSSIVVGGYCGGMLVMLVGPPGAGKSTFLVDDGLWALLQGYKVLHIYLGDMNPYDALVRYTAAYCGVDQKAVYLNATQFQTQQVSDILSRLRVVVYGYYEASADQLASYARLLYASWPFDMVIVDYDENISPVNVESLYESGGYTYGTLKTLAENLAVPVLVACQPKVQYWSADSMPLEAAAESSRKQHIIDMMISFSRPNRRSGGGTLEITKNRRGPEGYRSRVRFDMNVARIVQTTEDDYQRLLSVK